MRRRDASLKAAPDSRDVPGINYARPAVNGPTTQLIVVIFPLLGYLLLLSSSVSVRCVGLTFRIVKLSDLKDFLTRPGLKSRANDGSGYLRMRGINKCRPSPQGYLTNGFYFYSHHIKGKTDDSCTGFSIVSIQGPGVNLALAYLGGAFSVVQELLPFLFGLNLSTYVQS
ncbi:hypothetical protein J6590_024942 [Homalodisca vitripennis]|nr:hypothetical protein J6590_024942 [Homalodisca vitripennis]